MQKQSMLYVVLALLLLGLLGGGAYLLLDISKSDDVSVQTKPEVDVPLEQARSQPATPSSGLQVQGANSPAQSSAPQLPGPNDYEQYEQYAQSEGTQYIDTVVGAGEEAVAGSTVSVVYSGWLTDGTLFDQTRTNEQNQIVAFTFQLGKNQVIQGWEQGIFGMKVGGKRRLIIPSQFGYGPTGQGEKIPPNAMLIFDVELVGSR